jgi:rhodanese-related sulfurtransferase
MAAASVLLSGTLLVGTAGAAQFKDLSAQDLKAKLDGGEALLLINPLSDIEFNEAHIPGSVNIPVHAIAGSGRLPADKATPVVTYCLGPK